MVEASPGVAGMVFDIQRFSVHDGPGIRTTVFLKGCPLGCQWCHNPEGRSLSRQLGFSPQLCIGCGGCRDCCPAGAHAVGGGAHRLLREKCRQCFACAERCPSGALEAVGREVTVAEALAEALADREFYEHSGGGLTLGGGEPMQQFEFSRALLEAARAEGLRTCMETCGFAPEENYRAIAPLVKLFLFDCKETDPARHREFTGQSNELILKNLRLLARLGARTVLRAPIIPGRNLRDDHLEALARLSRSLDNCAGLEVLGYHPMGESKRERLGLPPAAAGEPMNAGQLAEVRAKLRRLGARMAGAAT